jgi:hypothetical protein
MSVAMPKLLLIQPRFVERSLAAQLAGDLQASAFTSPNTLAGTFSDSRGFALSFTHEGLPELARRFGSLKTFFDRVSKVLPARKMLPWHKRFTTSGQQFHCNAFYLNFLLLDSKAAIAPHVDATLSQEAGDLALRPEVVSVFYIDVNPKMRGGNLGIYTSQGRHLVKPKSNLCVHFRGDLTHEITPIENDEPLSRMSLVLEQYRLTPEQLQRIKPFRLHSKNSFSVYLKEEFKKPI